MRKGLHLYISEHYNSIIVTPLLINKAGIYYESEQSRTMKLWPTPDELGLAIKESLEASIEVDINLRDRKSTDWPSFKQSKLKTVKEFESKYSLILILASNEANNSYDARMVPQNDEELSIHISINPVPARLAKVGERIQKLYTQTKLFSSTIIKI